MTTIRVYHNLIDAHLAKVVLEQHEILAFIFDEHIVAINPLYAQTVGGLKLMVHAQDAERADKLLAQNEQSPYKGIDNKTLICPRCESEHIEANFHPLKDWKSFWQTIKDFFTLSFQTDKRRAFTCRVCDLEFSKYEADLLN
ncbi:MAG: DUF2007 domain-containing protein [Bernardetiaceae bacterium]|nr:DUF2007 domain-containing protein [Bernardetiaceae bacterium]